MLLFGLIQIVMSQIPDFHKMEWLSVVAAMMSFTYSFIGIALGFAKVIGMAVFAFFLSITGLQFYIKNTPCDLIKMYTVV